ncbi:MAG: response regulator [Pseudomonadota bacterium]
MTSSFSFDANSDAANSPQKPLADMSMLIVEDQFLVAVGIEKTFRLAGASDVTLVGNMEDAWEAVANEHFDAALLDIRLPDGYSFPLAIELFSKGMPVVMHSGHAEIYHSARLPGVIFCPKPATPAEIVRSVLKAKQFMLFPESPILEETLH